MTSAFSAVAYAAETLLTFARALGAPLVLRDLGLAESDLDRATELALPYTTVG